jgi:hypothetical protein
MEAIFFFAPLLENPMEIVACQNGRGVEDSFSSLLVNHLFLSRKMPLEEILQSSLQHEGCCNFQHFVT